MGLYRNEWKSKPVEFESRDYIPNYKHVLLFAKAEEIIIKSIELVQP